jgi:hypothetical protein
LNFAPGLWTDFEVGVNCGYGLAENDGIRVRFALGIFNVKPLSLFQIADRNTPAFKIGNNDITSFFSLIISVFAGG